MEVFSAQNVHNIIIYCNDLVDDCIRRTGGGQEEGVVAGEGDGEHQVERVQPQLHRDVLNEGKCEEKYDRNYHKNTLRTGRRMEAVVALLTTSIRGQYHYFILEFVQCIICLAIFY